MPRGGGAAHINRPGPSSEQHSAAKANGDGGGAGPPARRPARPRARPRSDSRGPDDRSRKRRRLRRASTVSSGSQEAGGDLDIGFPSAEQQPHVSRVSLSAAARHTGGPAESGAVAASPPRVEHSLLVAATPALVRTGAPETASISLQLTPASALEFMQNLEGCLSPAALSLLSSCNRYVLSHFEKIVDCEVGRILTTNTVVQLHLC